MGAFLRKLSSRRLVINYIQKARNPCLHKKIFKMRIILVTMKSAMVLMGEHRGALSIVRALGKKGILIYVGSPNTLCRSRFSKYCKKGFTYSSPYGHGAEKTHKDILKNVKKYKPEVLFTLGTITSYVVFKYQGEYEKYCNVIPNMGFKKFDFFNHKEKWIKEAIRVGYPVPKTYNPKKLSDVKNLSKKIDYPVLIKPRLSCGGSGIVKIFDANELIKEYKRLSSGKKYFYYDPARPLIQDFVPGKRYTVTGIFNKGKEIASVVFENFRHYPEYGSPLLNKTVRNERVRKTIIGMFKKMKWHGPFSVQCAIDLRDGKPKLFDINPRLWSCIGSTVAAGVNVPYIAFKMALGEKVDKVPDYKLNRKFRWMLFGELAYFMKSRNKLKLLRSYMDFYKTKTDVDIKDPLPHLMQFADMIKSRQVL